MDTSTAILQVAVILMAARIMGELAVYLRCACGDRRNSSPVSSSAPPCWDLSRPKA